MCSGGPLPHTRFTLPAAREKRLSMPEIGEKERDYLFKELYKLKSNDLMSSLRSQSPLEYPQTYTVLPSPSAQSGVPYIRKRNRSLWFLSAQAVWSQKDAAWLPHLGLDPSTNLPLPHHFRLLLQLATAASIPVFFQLYWAAIVSPGRHGPVVWSQSSPSSHVVSVTGGIASQLYRGLKLIASPWLRARATAI